MNRYGISFFTGAALLALTSVQAQAGGVYEVEGSMKDTVSDAVMVPAPMPIPQTTAWYIRGDVTYGAHDGVGLVEDRQYSLTDSDIDDSWSVGGGIGYYFTPRFRGDITVDYLADTEIEGENLDATAPVGGGKRTFDLHSTVALANLYYDFNMHGKFSPYVGVGLGVAYNETGAGNAAGTTYARGLTGAIDGASETNFAWALMAGASYQITTGFRLDASYRYLDLGSAQSGAINDTTVDVNVLPVPPRVPVNGGSIKVDDIEVHQFRIGFRQDIW